MGPRGGIFDCTPYPISRFFWGRTVSNGGAFFFFWGPKMGKIQKKIGEKKREIFGKKKSWGLLFFSESFFTFFSKKKKKLFPRGNIGFFLKQSFFKKKKGPKMKGFFQKRGGAWWFFFLSLGIGGGKPQNFPLISLKPIGKLYFSNGKKKKAN